MPLLDLKVGVWCGVSAAWGHCLSPHYHLPLPPRFFRRSCIHADFLHVHFLNMWKTSRKTMSLLAIQGKQFCVLFVFFSCQNNKQGIWPCSSGLNPCTRLFYLWVLLKDEVSINNPCTEEELKKSLRDVEPSFSPAEPRRAMNRLYMTQVCGSKETFSSTFCMHTVAWFE